MARVAYPVTGDVEAARDATEVAWATAWRRLHTLRDHGQVRAWLVAIAANEARQMVRNWGTRTIVDISEALDAAPAADPADRIATVDLARALARLKPDDRALLALRFAAGLDSTEIAAQLHLTPSGVRSRSGAIRITRLAEANSFGIQPTLTPDGTQVVFVTDKVGENAVMGLVPVAGAEVTPATTSGFVEGVHPRFRPTP
ncbi:MAG: sigma-70 family RNA polymerase sigma factor [Candidatus Limnocylindrales bacterium]